MIFDFLNILTLLLFFTGVVSLVDIVWRRVKNLKLPQVNGKIKHPIIIEYCRSFFPIILIVLIIRSFLYQPYYVPSGSLEPTVLPGDFLLVNQFDYGVRLPVWYTKIINIGEPKTGQIMLFRWPVNPAITFVKRVVGVPGDRISFINNVFYINGVQQKQTFVKNTYDIEENNSLLPAKEYIEDLGGVKHYILRMPDRPAQNFRNLVVPKDMYFMVGDNRENSDDSRFWGFVPQKDIIGRAQMIIMSWNKGHLGFRTHRFGASLQINSKK